MSKACSPHTKEYSIEHIEKNKPSLVGVVDPVDATHEGCEAFPGMQTILIEDVLGDLNQQMGEGEEITREGILDDSQEHQHLENVHNAFLAVRNNRLSELEMLMDEGVKVSDRDANGNTLLLVAAQQGLKRIAKFLLRRNADINQVNNAGNSVLHYCFQYNFSDLATYLLSKGADDQITNQAGLTCYEGINLEEFEKL